MFKCCIPVFAKRTMSLTSLTYSLFFETFFYFPHKSRIFRSCSFSAPTSSARPQAPSIIYIQGNGKWLTSSALFREAQFTASPENNIFFGALSTRTPGADKNPAIYQFPAVSLGSFSRRRWVHNWIARMQLRLLLLSPPAIAIYWYTFLGGVDLLYVQHRKTNKSSARRPLCVVSRKHPHPGGAGIICNREWQCAENYNK